MFYAYVMFGILSVSSGYRVSSKCKSVIYYNIPLFMEVRIFYMQTKSKSYSGGLYSRLKLTCMYISQVTLCISHF
jgi:hypothetical protein